MDTQQLVKEIKKNSTGKLEKGERKVKDKESAQDLGWSDFGGIPKITLPTQPRLSPRPI